MTDGQGFLIDSNVLLDVITEDPVWYPWSSHALGEVVRGGVVLINPIIYAEVSVGYDRIEELDARLPPRIIRRAPLPFSAGFLAAKAHQAYRRRGGARTTTLPDFFIGAHAAIEGLTLVTRDARRYRTAFPKLDLMTPERPIRS